MAHLHEAVHNRNLSLLQKWDTAVSSWEDSADVYIESMDGILGILADTPAEDTYQRWGTVQEGAAMVGTGADAASLIPPFAPAAQVISLLATAVEVTAAKAQAIEAQRIENGHGSGDVRVVEGQAAGEDGQAVAAQTGFIPMADLVRGAFKLRHNRELRDAWSDVVDKFFVVANNAPIPANRHAEPEVDIGVNLDPIDTWAGEAEATNPEHEYTPNQPMPTSFDDPDAESVQLPSVSGPPPENPAKVSGITVTVPDEE